MPPKSPDHMVVVRFSALGDVALTTGVLMRWRETLGLSFTVLTRESFTPLFFHHPAVREVVGLKPDDLHGERQRRLFRDLAARFQGVPLVDLHGTLRTRLLTVRWRGPVRRYPKHALARRLFLLSGGRVGRDVLLRHNVPQRYSLALPHDDEPAPAVQLRPRLFLTADELARADELLAPLRSAYAPCSPLIALHPFATHAAKSWPLNVWRDFAALLDNRGLPYFWVGQGTPPEGGGRDFVNRTDLRLLCALLARADVLVTGDSGPMHLAAGVDTPVVALFGPTCREWGFFPADGRNRILQIPMSCRPCSLHGKRACPRGLACLTGLTPALALETVESILAAGARSTRTS